MTVIVAIEKTDSQGSTIWRVFDPKSKEAKDFLVKNFHNPNVEIAELDVEGFQGTYE